MNEYKFLAEEDICAIRNARVYESQDVRDNVNDLERIARQLLRERDAFREYLSAHMLVTFTKETGIEIPRVEAQAMMKESLERCDREVARILENQSLSPQVKEGL